MTTSHYSKVFKQLKGKPAKLAKYKKHNAPKKRTTGKALRRCKRCGTSRGFIQRWGLNLCRRCFRDIAPSIGFKKYD